MESLLTLYLELTEEFRPESSKESFDAACTPYIELTPPTIEKLVQLAGKQNTERYLTWAFCQSSTSWRTC